jgi:transposase
VSGRRGVLDRENDFSVEASTKTQLYCRRFPVKRREVLSPSNKGEPMSYDLIVALDRADREIDVCLQKDGMIEMETVASAPEALSRWWQKVRDEHPGAKIAVVFEQPAENLLAFFAEAEASIYALNPAVVARYRGALYPSGAKDDWRDCKVMADLIGRHQEQFKPWPRDSAAVRRLTCLVEGRRALVQQRVDLGNQLQSVLKKSYPQALTLVGRDLWRPLATDFLRRWPTLQSLQKTRPQTLRSFYYLHRSRRPGRIDQRLQAIAAAVPLTEDPALTEPAALLVVSLVRIIEQVVGAIERFDAQIKEVFPNCQDAALFRQLPGAGPALAPRLACAFGEDRTRFTSAAQLQTYSGIAPITKQTGQTKTVARRRRCPHFLRQTFHEYAACSVQSSLWAKAFYLTQRQRGKRHNAAVRALAFKWQRILFACWQRRCPYDEQRYLDSLLKAGSPLVAVIKTLKAKNNLSAA